MAAQLYLLTKANSASPNQTYVDDIHACIVNSDDGGSDAVKIAEAIAQARVAGHALPDGYFDTVELLGPPTAGIMTTDEDTMVILRRGTSRVIA